jgi:hypothetical protein
MTSPLKRRRPVTSRLAVVYFGVETRCQPGSGYFQELDLHHVLGLGAFAAFDYFKLHFLAFFQGPEALALDVAVVHEDIGTVFLGNKSIALGITEPLYLASYSHYLTSNMFLPRGSKTRQKNKGNDR